ncbi:methylenetetrahydrofolate reductase [NAD(P)H] [Lacticaseibacillus zhaodongensis]|uniref:methylenetetrahydrofolate reductase [NAD(P)H] n=1 Tax=Lacticaseibacillus zhaodongensis TaxID=2668065 RepID=UPI0012D3372D|nr:methylenetetrahydrofolate reductase [NAD(P)H] [Lacticaseibacillus zhaodongensis]
MKTSDFFRQDKPVFSFEVFPPRNIDNDGAEKRVCETMDVIQEVQPDFVSVTYRGGGSNPAKATIQIASMIKDRYHTESVVHLPAARLDRAAVDDFLARAKDAGIQNILALRGDIPEGGRYSDDFHYASDLVAYIKQHGDFNILGACYPEGHPESPDALSDIRHLKTKVDAGTSELISQLFFDNEAFYKFVDRCRFAGIDVPIEAGIMPIMSTKQAERMRAMSGVELPAKLSNILDKFADKPDALRDAGIAYAIEQIVDLMAHGVDGIHLYTMDNPTVAGRIIEATRNIIRS